MLGLGYYFQVLGIFCLVIMSHACTDSIHTQFTCLSTLPGKEDLHQSIEKSGLHENSCESWLAFQQLGTF